MNPDSSDFTINDHVRHMRLHGFDEWANAVEAALARSSEQAGDMVDKATAWDACVKAREEERERCAKIAEPKGPRPCDCEYGACYCRNAGDAAAVASWDADMAVARAIRAPVSGSGDANG